MLCYHSLDPHMNEHATSPSLRTIACLSGWVGADEKGIWLWSAPEPALVRDLVAEVSRRTFEQTANFPVGTSAHERMVGYAQALARDYELVSEGVVEVWWNGTRRGLDESLHFSKENMLVFVSRPTSS
jgi:hypothetical protein